ncbi:MAG: 5/3-nucleotidase [Desulfovibrionales bacterium]|jgi:5'-nucleotidase|nr:5/3-nucleotidase [Desulfovibrionales bacterium]
MRVLLTNDDGIQAVGLRAMYAALRKAGHEVDCVAPLTEMSAVGHALTFTSPLRIKRFAENGFRGVGVNGTPVDCVKLALGSILEIPPDLVVSGINSGANVGVDILYSGTVSAATEGALMDLPSLAVSHDDFNPLDLSDQAGYAAGFIDRMDWAGLPKGLVLNLNFPNLPLGEAKELKVCRHTRASYSDWYEKRVDPRGREYYWLCGELPLEKVSSGTDKDLLNKGHITLTPLRFNFNDVEALEGLDRIFPDTH